MSDEKDDDKSKKKNENADSIVKPSPSLTARELKVLKQRFGIDAENDISLADVDEAFKVSVERIKEIEERALNKLRRNPAYVKPQSWQEIRDRYRLLPEDSEVRQSMLELVEHIASLDIGKRIHIWTSMYELRITQTSQHPFQESVAFLQISPFPDGCAEFRYFDSDFKSKHWVRMADKGRLSERFDSFIEQAGWVSKKL